MKNFQQRSPSKLLVPHLARYLLGEGRHNGKNWHRGVPFRGRGVEEASISGWHAVLTAVGRFHEASCQARGICNNFLILKPCATRAARENLAEESGTCESSSFSYAFGRVESRRNGLLEVAESKHAQAR